MLWVKIPDLTLLSCSFDQGKPWRDPSECRLDVCCASSCLGWARLLCTVEFIQPSEGYPIRNRLPAFTMDPQCSHPTGRAVVAPHSLAGRPCPMAAMQRSTEGRFSLGGGGWMGREGQSFLPPGPSISVISWECFLQLWEEQCGSQGLMREQDITAPGCAVSPVLLLAAWGKGLSAELLERSR